MELLAIDRATRFRGGTSRRRRPGIRAAKLLRGIARRRLPWAVLTWGLAGYALVFFVWAVGPIDVSPDTRNFIGDVAFVPPGIIAALLAFRAAATPGSTRQTRRAWAWLGFAYLAYWAGDVLYFVYDVVANAVPFPSLADVGYLVYYPLLLVGLVSFPRVLPTGTHRLRFALDVATVAVGGAMVVWYFVLGPIAEEAHPHIVETLVSVAYPVGDLVLLLGLAITVTRAPRELPRQALALLLAGLVVSLVADLAYGVQNLDNSYESGRWVDAVCRRLGTAWGERLVRFHRSRSS